MTVANNPAGRLYAFLIKAKGLPSQSATSLGQQFYKLFPFATGANDNLTFLQEVNVIAELLEEIDRQLQLCDQDHLEVFTDARRNFSGLINVIPLQQPWQNYVAQYMRDSDMVTLRFVSITLSRAFGEPFVSGEEIDALRQQVVELKTAMSQATVSQRLKDYVLKSLQQVDRALAEYELRGASGLDDVLGSTIGRAVLHPDFAATAIKQEGAGTDEWQHRFWNLMGQIASKAGAAEVTQHFSRLLKSELNPSASLASSNLQTSGTK